MSTFGTLFRVTTYGESHCPSVGCIVDGCPPVRTSIAFYPSLDGAQPLAGPSTHRKGHSTSNDSTQTRSISTNNASAPLPTLLLRPCMDDEHRETKRTPSRFSLAPNLASPSARPSVYESRIKINDRTITPRPISTLVPRTPTGRICSSTASKRVAEVDAAQRERQ